jgi:hypothetical protein
MESWYIRKLKKQYSWICFDSDVDIGVVWGKCVGVGMDFALKGN